MHNNGVHFIMYVHHLTKSDKLFSDYRTNWLNFRKAAAAEKIVPKADFSTPDLVRSGQVAMCPVS